MALYNALPGFTGESVDNCVGGYSESIAEMCDEHYYYYCYCPGIPLLTHFHTLPGLVSREPVGLGTSDSAEGRIWGSRRAMGRSGPRNKFE